MKVAYLSLTSLTLAGILITPVSLKAQSAKDLVIDNNRATQSNSFFQPVSNLITDLQKQGLTIGDPSERLSVKYQVSKPCTSCSLYVGTGVSNGEKDINNGMGVNLGVGFSMPLSK